MSRWARGGKLLDFPMEPAVHLVMLGGDTRSCAVVLLMVQKFWCVSFFCANTLLEEEIGNEFWNHQQISTGMELSCIRRFLQGIAGFLACNDCQKKEGSDFAAALEVFFTLVAMIGNVAIGSLPNCPVNCCSQDTSLTFVFFFQPEFHLFGRPGEKSKLFCMFFFLSVAFLSVFSTLFIDQTFGSQSVLVRDLG